MFEDSTDSIHSVSIFIVAHPNLKIDFLMRCKKLTELNKKNLKPHCLNNRRKTFCVILITNTVTSLWNGLLKLLVPSGNKKNKKIFLALRCRKFIESMDGPSSPYFESNVVSRWS